jgi:hypothetical protein
MPSHGAFLFFPIWGNETVVNATTVQVVEDVCNLRMHLSKPRAVFRGESA